MKPPFFVSNLNVILKSDPNDTKRENQDLDFHSSTFDNTVSTSKNQRMDIDKQMCSNFFENTFE